MSSKAANERRIAAMTEAEIQDVMVRTTVYAEKMISSKTWRSVKGGLLPGGRSAQDLAYTAFQNILNGGKWDDDKPLPLVMKGFIRGSVGNLAASWENRKISSIDEKSADGEDCGRSVVDQIATDDLDPVEKIQRREDGDLLHEIVGGLKEGSVEQRIAESIVNGASNRAEVVDDTGLTTGEYDAGRKRLRRSLEKYRQERSTEGH